ncbi:hypothetical protein ABPG74_010279 [Tetrahymena malaccensis]
MKELEKIVQSQMIGDSGNPFNIFILFQKMEKAPQLDKQKGEQVEMFEGLEVKLRPKDHSDIFKNIPKKLLHEFSMNATNIQLRVKYFQQFVQKQNVLFL